jgi:hypothetical protein
MSSGICFQSEAKTAMAEVIWIKKDVIPIAPDTTPKTSAIVTAGFPSRLWIQAIIFRAKGPGRKPESEELNVAQMKSLEIINGSFNFNDSSCIQVSILTLSIEGNAKKAESRN